MKNSTVMCTLRATKTLFLLGVIGFASVSFYQFHQRLTSQHRTGSLIKLGNGILGKLNLHHKVPPIYDYADTEQEAKNEPAKSQNGAQESKTETTKTGGTTFTSTLTSVSTEVKTPSTPAGPASQSQQNSTSTVKQSNISSNNTSNQSQHNTTTSTTTTPAPSTTAKKSKMYAVYACNTPTLGKKGSYDYAFYLPLTALAWERLGYSSIVVLIGKKEDWEKDQVLQIVLKELSQRDARVIFLDAAPVNGVMLSQTSRFFVVNMKQAELNDDDYILTSDADVWPLRREHFARKPGYDLTVMHDKCCGTFKHKEKNYTMLPVCHIGAPVKVWKDIVNRNGTSAQDAETILQYFESYFGKEVVRNAVEFQSDGWYLDQKLLSILVNEWTERTHAEPRIHKVSDEGFNRVDQAQWDAGNFGSKDLDQNYDAHLPELAYEPKVWNNISPLVKLMYGNDSAQAKWSNEYAGNFAKGVEAIRNTTAS